jgi:hypothetical protein
MAAILMRSAIQQLAKPTALQVYLSTAAAKPFKWGQHDCCTFIAGWAERITGKNPSDPWRGAYCSEAMADAILAHGGGLGLTLKAALAPIGFVPVTGCAPGDVSVVRAPTPTGPKLCASLFVGRGQFALLSSRGLVVAQLPFMSLSFRHPDARHHA